MEYQVISRKYRPQRFDEVVGQDHISLTLQNAIKFNRISHAYLFTGSRGIGKTSTARILAKTLNCQNPQEHNPCNSCQNCVEITAGRSMDVLEIDGASNRGIDQIRDLRENVKYPPANSHYRIYIIDEVHMLTKEAFNALLKTLEEPPKHVLFMFATTEPLKVPETIISRCQRYDFHRISVQDIVAQLQKIVRQEKVQISDDLLMLIAKKAEGGLRDAESLLDQLIAFSGNEVTLEKARQVLSLIDYDFFIKLGDAILENDRNALVDYAARIIDEGHNIAEFISEFLEHFRNLMIAGATRSLDHLDLPENVKKQYLEEADKWQVEDILRIIKLLTEAQTGLRTALNHRIHLEYTFLRLGALTRTVTLQEILDRVEKASYQVTSDQGRVKESLDLFADSRSASKAQTSRDVSAEKTVKKPSSEEPAPTSTDDPERILSRIRDRWEEIIAQVENSNMSLATFLKSGTPVRIRGNVLELEFDDEAIFHANSIKKRIAVVEQAIGEVLELSLRVKCIAKKLAGSKSTKNKKFEEVSRKIMDMFDGEVIIT